MENNEMEAVEFAGQMAGEFIESIQKYDIRTLTRDEWIIFISCICKNYEKKKTDICPF